MKRLWLFGALLFGPIAHAAPAVCGTEGVAVQVLGSGDGSFAAHRAGSSTLIWVDGKARVLVNAGSGAAMRYHDSNAQWNDLDAIVFTRMDAAHATDLAALLQAAKASGRNRPLPIYGPAGNRLAPSTVTAMRDLFDPVRGIYRHLGNLLAPLDRSSYKLEPHDVREPPAKLAAPRRKGPSPLAVMQNDRLHLEAVPHVDENVPVLAWRINAGATVIVFDSGVRSTTIPLATLANGATLLVSPLHSAHGNPTDDPTTRPLAIIAQVAQSARIRQLLLIGRGTRIMQIEEEISGVVRKSFTGTTVLADDLGCYRP